MHICWYRKLWSYKQVVLITSCRYIQNLQIDILKVVFIYLWQLVYKDNLFIRKSVYQQIYVYKDSLYINQYNNIYCSCIQAVLIYKKNSLYIYTFLTWQIAYWFEAVLTYKFILVQAVLTYKFGKMYSMYNLLKKDVLHIIFNCFKLQNYLI